MSFGFGRIEYDGNVIELTRPWTDFQPARRINSSRDQAESGIEETLFSFAQWFINARLNLLDPQEKAQLQRLFEYAEDGSSFTLIRDRELGTFIPFEGGINPSAAPRGLKTIDDVNGTFTRTNVASSAWYLDEGTGLVTLRDGANVPRFPTGKYGAGLQVDGARTNDADPDMDPASSSWTATTLTVDDDTTETLAPDGTSTAHKLTSTGASGFITLDTGRTVTSNDYTFSIYMKANEATTVSVEMQIRGTGGGTAQLLGPFNLTATGSDGNGFTRYQLNYEDGVDSALTTNFEIRIRVPTSGHIFYAWCPQGEVGLFASSPIVSSATLRNTEKITFASANTVNRDKGTISMWINPAWASTQDPAGKVFFNSGDSGGATADWHMVFYHTVANGLQLEARIDNGASAAFSYSRAAALTAGTLHHIVGTWDATISNGHNLYLDGVSLGASSNSPYNISETGDSFAIGSELDGDQPTFSTIDEVLILKKVLSATEIAGISNLGIGLGVQRNRWTVQLNSQVFNPQWLQSDVYDIPLLMKEVLT